MTKKRENTFEGLRLIKEAGGIEEYKIDKNDLTDLTSEDNTAPIVIFMDTYHVETQSEATVNTE